MGLKAHETQKKQETQETQENQETQETQEIQETQRYKSNYLQLQVAEKIEVVFRLDGCNVAAAPKVGSARLGIPTQPNTHTVGRREGCTPADIFSLNLKPAFKHLFSTMCLEPHHYATRHWTSKKNSDFNVNRVLNI